MKRFRTKWKYEVWRDIPGYEGLYQVSSRGRIKSLERTTRNTSRSVRVVKEKILKPSRNIKGKGYYFVNLSKKGKTKIKQVHQLVVICFHAYISNGRKWVVNHKDFDKLNNWAYNLEVITHRENINHREKGGTSKYAGVHWDKKHSKWMARILYKGKRRYLGSFTDEMAAAQAYQDVLKELSTPRRRTKV